MPEISEDLKLRIYHHILITMKATNPSEAAYCFKVVCPANGLGEITDDQAETLVAEMNAYLVKVGNPTVIAETAALDILSNIFGGDIS